MDNLFNTTTKESIMKGTTPTQRATALARVLRHTYEDIKTKAVTAQNVTDMLIDLRHLCDAKNIDFADRDRIAYDHYCVERRVRKEATR
jgi:hypothetical protein